MMTMHVSPPAVAATMLAVLVAGDVAAGYSPFGSAPAPQVKLSCGTPTHAAGSPKFGMSPPGVAEYTFRGLCRGTDGRDYVSYWSTGTWTPGEKDPAKANASEVYRIELHKNVWQTRDPSPRGDGVLTFLFGARCDRDPWLNPDAQCRAVGNNVPDDVKAAWPEIVSAPFPRSRSALADDERRRLRVAYERANPVVRAGEADRVPVRAGGASPLDSSRIAGGQRATAPRIVQPEPGSRAAARLRVQVAPVAGADGAQAEVVLTFVPPRAREPGRTAPAAPPPQTFTTTVRELVQGVVLPPGVTPAKSGTWTVKVRALPASGPGTWSDEVAFQFETASPKSIEQAAQKATRLDAATLNPQPLPPRSAFSR